MLRSAIRKLLPMSTRRRLREFAREVLFKTPPPPLEPDARREFSELFRRDILALQELLDRDLGNWLQ
ncbi:MAG: hypothetical protein GTO41_02855 [Burkholderiales bacterium]|nr:hypothetical protein [Burkholderiales bacterium]